MIKIQGTRDLERVAAQLTVAGNVELRRQMLRNIRVAVEPVKPLIRQEALTTLPKSGGLNELVAAAPISIGATISPKTATVKVGISSGRKSKAAKNAQAALARSRRDRGESSAGWIVRDLRSIDNGRARHPVFGDRDRWSDTAVKPGFFTRPCEKFAPVVRAACAVTVKETALAAGFK